MKYEKEEILNIKKECKRFLHGHYLKKPKDFFLELSKETPKDEWPDFYGEGKAIQDFEAKLATMFGHEDCVFLQSGTMAQLIAMRIWTDRLDNNLIGFHSKSHLELHEENSYKKLHNLSSIFIGEPDRLITLKDLEEMAQKPAAVLLELPQREIGGQLPSWEDLTKQIGFLKSQEIKVHMDGARLWECKRFYQKSYAEIAGLFDSVYISFYKGIGAIAGAALIGSNEFIKEARVWNRRHGGNLITSAPLYLSAELNMKKRIDNFESYFEKTLKIVEVISKFNEMEVEPAKPQINMFHLYIKGDETLLREKAIAASNRLGIWGLGHLRQSEREGYCKAEWYVGDATLDVWESEVEGILSSLVE